MSIVYGEEAAAEALREFLEDGVSGALRLNDLLETYRTEKSIDETELPDVASFETLYDRGSQATPYPNMAIVWDGCEGEDEGTNARMVNHRFDLVLFMLAAQISGDETDAAVAAARYTDVIRALFFRRLPMGSQGWTLNNGGTGDAKGRVIRCSIDSQDRGPLEDPTDPNWIVLTRLTVRMEEAW